jgi:hypothetical protein
VKNEMCVRFEIIVDMYNLRLGKGIVFYLIQYSLRENSMFLIYGFSLKYVVGPLFVLNTYS